MIFYVEVAIILRMTREIALALGRNDHFNFADVLRRGTIANVCFVVHIFPNYR